MIHSTKDWQSLELLQSMATKPSQRRTAEGDYPSALSARVGFLLAKAHQVALEETERVLTEFGLSRKGYAALATVVTDAPISQQRLSQRIGMDPATMVDVIDTLEESGYLERRRNPNDRREYALRATPKGKALFAQAQRAVIGAESRAFRGLDPD